MKINTIYGERDEKDLVKSVYRQPDGTWITEYYLNEELVHRSAMVQLCGVQALGHQAKFG